MDASKKKVIRFTCYESIEEDDDFEENKFERQATMGNQGRNSNVNMVGLVGDASDSGPT